MNGRLTGFSSDRLLRHLTGRGQDVVLVAKAGTTCHPRFRLPVIDHAA